MSSLLQLHFASAQQPLPRSPLSPPAQQQEDRISQIGIGHKLTIRTNDGTEYHGRLASIAQESFSLREVDLGTTETVRYADIVNSYRNYGGKGVHGRPVNPKTNVIAVAALGAALVIIVAAVELKNRNDSS